MRLILLKLTLTVAVCCCLNVVWANEARESDYFPLWQKSGPNVTDLALIYQGGAQRPQWTTDRFSPYVSYRDPQAGTEQWLFDGFLFIEFQDGRRHTFQPYPKLEPARKDEWLALLDKNFAADDGIPNLDRVCRQTAKRIGEPVRRRQVILTLPTPIIGQTNWGKIKDCELDFRKQSDRLAACEWYVQTALDKWQALAPRQLDLAGFYWVHESAPATNVFLLEVAKIVHRHGKQFSWIPYWHLNRLPGNWRSYRFDVAWQQPNHFFHPEVPDSRLTDACAFAREHGMGMEMEFDGRMFSDSKVFAPRFDAYLDAFVKTGVKDSSAIAYYEGGGALFTLAKSKEPEMQARYARLAKFILERQAVADQKAREGR